MKKTVLSISMLSISLLFACSTPDVSSPLDTTSASEKEPEEMDYNWSVDESVMQGKSANDASFAVENTPAHESLLSGKTFYWLGSSVTYGATSEQEAVPEYLAKTTGSYFKKDAVSGTTLFTAKGNRNSYTYRLTNSKEFDKNASIDGFIIQISTNDALNANLTHRGQIEDDSVIYSENFDLSTTLGGVEYIINYIKETWDCPIFFYSGSYIASSGARANSNPSGENYATLVSQVKQVEAKYDKLDDFDVNIIDLFNDETFNAKVSDTYYKWAMNDPVHPRKDGYRQWWTPYVERCLIQYYK